MLTDTEAVRSGKIQFGRELEERVNRGCVRQSWKARFGGGISSGSIRCVRDPIRRYVPAIRNYFEYNNNNNYYHHNLLIIFFY